MRKINLPLILDTVFTALCAFLLFFTAMRFYTKNAVLALVFGILAGGLFGTLGFVYISKKQNKKLLLSKDEREKKLLALHLSLSSDAYVLKLFESCFEGGKNENGKIETDEEVCFFNFKMQALSEDDIARVIKFSSEKKKKIFCCKIAPEALLLAENFLIETLLIDDVYKLLSEKNLLPEKYVYEGPEKISVFKKIKARFSRKLCAPLFWSGLGLLALSYFTFFPVYYIVSGGILLILSAVALVVN